MNATAQKPGRRDRHIVAMGGGGFSMEPENPLLDDFILRLTGKRRPRVCISSAGDWRKW